MSWRREVKKVLTVAYLFSAFVVTAATSKRQDHAPEMAEATAAGITNYMFQSNCQNRPAAVAIRVENMVITQQVLADGGVNEAFDLDFTHLGFPSERMLVGMDQAETPLFKRKCSVRSKLARHNPSYDQAASAYWFIQPGFLTTVNYDCYESGVYSCSVTLDELPAGDLKKSLSENGLYF